MLVLIFHSPNYLHIRVLFTIQYEEASMENTNQNYIKRNPYFVRMQNFQELIFLARQGVLSYFSVCRNTLLTNIVTTVHKKAS